MIPVAVGFALAVAALYAVGCALEAKGKRRQPPERSALVVVCPLSLNVDEAMRWFHERGATEVRLWAGPDGTVRGFGVLR